MANSKEIGNSYERSFSYELSEWITEEPGSSICWRDKSSGARHTVRNKSGQTTSGSGGDIYPTDSTYEYWFSKFYIDSKSYFKINPIFTNPKNQRTNDILSQWLKTVSQCPQDKLPIMPTKIRDRVTPELIFLPEECAVNAHGSIHNDVLILSDLKIKVSKSFSFTVPKGERYRFKYILKTEFFEMNNYDQFYQDNINFENSQTRTDTYS